MSNVDDSDLDINVADTDECTQIRVQPSIQSGFLSNLNKFSAMKPVKNPRNKDPIVFHSREVSKSNISNRHSNKTKSTLDIDDFESRNTSCDKKRSIDSNVVTQRLYDFQEKVNAKVKSLVKEKEELEMEECSFQPNITKNVNKRSIQTFLRHMQHFSDVKNDRIKQLQEENKIKLEQEQKTFKKNPEIKQKKTNVKRKQAVFSRKNSSPQVPSFSFQPMINPASKMIKRPEKIENLLYSDAVKRSNATRTSPTFELKSHSSPKSEQVLIKKFDAEYTKVVNDLDFDSSGLLNYSKFCQVLSKLHFISSSIDKPDAERELLLKAWKYLCGHDSGKVNKKNLNIFLLAVVNLCKKTRASSNDTIVSGMKNGMLCLSMEDVKRIHKEFNVFFSNRRSQGDSCAAKEQFKVLSKRSSVVGNVLSKRSSVTGQNATLDQRVTLLKETVENRQTIIEETFISNMNNSHSEGVLNEKCQNLSISPKSIIIRKPEALKLERMEYNYSKPTLSIPKVAPQKSISLRSASASPELLLQRVKFSYHSISPDSSKKSVNFSLHTSESEPTDQSLINPLVTPPSRTSRMHHKELKFMNNGILGVNIKEKAEEIKKEECRSSKRYKCHSPDSYEESEESILVTVVLPDDSEQFLRIHRDDNLNSLLNTFGKKHHLDKDQLLTLKDEITMKLK